MLNKYLLNPQSINFIISQINQGNALTKHLLNLELFKGNVITYLPENINLNTLLNFEEGGKSYSNLSTLHLIDFVKSYIFTDITKHNYSIFESFARFNDPILKSIKIQYFLYNYGIYFYGNKKSSEEEIKNAIIHAKHYPFIGLLTSLDEPDNMIDNGQFITDNIIRSIVNNIEYILIGAYDMEGYLIWSI